uniref:Uncharacterized protein n=1 Tax=Tanacetum cinerariifolium TaxID=118510 RepID=A0A699XFM5_TANCI|nr:hypothetical protein [Tanacetum cinerariifolium]
MESVLCRDVRFRWTHVGGSLLEMHSAHTDEECGAKVWRAKLVPHYGGACAKPVGLCNSAPRRSFGGS